MSVNCVKMCHLMENLCKSFHTRGNSGTFEPSQGDLQQMCACPCMNEHPRIASRSHLHAEHSDELVHLLRTIHQAVGEYATNSVT